MQSNDIVMCSENQKTNFAFENGCTIRCVMASQPCHIMSWLTSHGNRICMNYHKMNVYCHGIQNIYLKPYDAI